VRGIAWRLLLLLVAGLLLQGCSAVRFGYGNADALTRWWIDQYLDLSPEQDLLVRDRVARLHAWHRKSQLPAYLALLRQGQSFVAGRPSAADALALVDGMIRSGRQLADQATPDVADLLLTVTPAQIERMAARFAERNAEHANEARLGEGESAQRQARYKRLLERAEYWFGDFGDEQKAALRRMIEHQPAGGQLWHDERLRRQRQWLALVSRIQRDQPPRERAIGWLRDYAASFELPADPAAAAAALALRRAGSELTVAIHAMANPEQRAHALHKLGDLIHDIEELAREGR
jgi:hypothetical protein